MAVYEWQHKEVLQAAINMGIDTSNLDLIDLINMMASRWLRSTPQNAPIKGSGKGVGKGKSSKSSNSPDTSNENAQKSNKQNPRTQKKGEESEDKKKKTLLVLLKDTYQLTTVNKYSKEQINAALKCCEETKFIPMSTEIEFRKLSQIRVTCAGSESEDSSRLVSTFVTEYKHVMLPTDYNTLTSEDSTI